MRSLIKHPDPPEDAVGTPHSIILTCMEGDAPWSSLAAYWTVRLREKGYERGAFHKDSTDHEKALGFNWLIDNGYVEP